jgi:hypothetical protein
MVSLPESVGIKPVGLMEYDVDVFERLPRFHVAKEFLKQHSFSRTQLGDIICAYGLESFFGINLLHKHFDVNRDEKVVREFENNVAYMRPYRAGQCPPSVPYLWQFTSGRHGEGFYPLEFISFDDDAERQVALLQLEVLSEAHGFWRELADKLTELDLRETFGVAALWSREDFVLKEGEALLETTDEARRILTLEPILESSLGPLDTTETLWTFTPPKA